MATQADLRRIALSLPAAEPIPGRFAFGVARKGKLNAFAWVWMERVTPKKPRVPNHGVIAARVADLAERDRLLSANPGKFFTEPHYDGFPAVLVRLDAVTVPELRNIIIASWRCQAPSEETGRTSSASKKTKSPPRRSRRSGSTRPPRSRH